MSTTPASRSRMRRVLIVAGIAIALLGAAYFFYGPELFVTREIFAARNEIGDDRADLAQVRLEALDRRYPHRSDVAYWLAVANRRQEHLSVAEDLLTQAELLGHDPEQIVLQRALIRCRSGGFDQVETLLRDSLTKGVDDETAADVYDAMASGFIVSYRLKDAWQCIDYWISWQPRAIKPHLLRAAISEQTLNRNLALEDYQAVVAIDPRHAEGRLKLAQALLDLNRGGEALAEFKRGLEDHPDRFEFRIGIASCQRSLGQFEEAKQTLDLLLQERLSKTLRPQVLRTAGEVEIDRGEFEHAIRLLNSAARLTPRDPQVHRGLFRAMSLSGKSELAKRHQETYEKLSADTNRLREVTGQIVEEPQRVDLRHEAGQILARNEFTEEAIGWWLSALRIDPQYRPTHRALAEVYARQGKTTLAEFHQRASKQAGPDEKSSPDTANPKTKEASVKGQPTATGGADGPRP